VANSIRLAHVYQWMKHFDRAEALFIVVINKCREDSQASEYLSFALQHYGKLTFDQERYDEALEYFEAAMELRRNAGDQSLIDSTQLALDITRKRISEA
jgi:tetratricopeptide (TPR) repeat protein